MVMWKEIQKAALLKGIRTHKKDNGKINCYTDSRQWETTEEELIKYIEK